MKDITRIQLAKIPYNIETDAKQSLNAYVALLEAYTNDTDLMRDIEIRMTEILAERGIIKDGVIALDDVTKIRQQLGEPKEFADGTAEETDLIEAAQEKRLYRNMDTALIGGVLSGIATYFHVRPLWLRIGYVILTLLSFGMFVFVYILLWVVVPPARTAAEKLQLNGKPVTLSSIRELNDATTLPKQRSSRPMAQRIITFIIGCGAVIGALVVLAMIIALIVGVTFFFPSIEFGHEFTVPYILGMSAATLLLVLCILIAYAAFAQKFSPRIWISGIVIIVLGLGAFGGAIGTGLRAENEVNNFIEKQMTNKKIELPESFKSITSLTVEGDSSAHVIYVVDTSVVAGDQRTFMDAIQTSVTVDGTSATLHVKQNSSSYRYSNTVTIHGPALETIVATNSHISYRGTDQPNLSITTKNGASVTLDGGRVSQLTTSTHDSSSVTGSDATVRAVNATIYDESTQSYGTIRSLAITHQEACPSSMSLASINVTHISSAKYTINGETARQLSTTSYPCAEVTIEQ